MDLTIARKLLKEREPLAVILICGVLDTITGVLRFANRSWRGPSVLMTNDDPQAKRETEAAGEFQAVYVEEEWR